MTLRLNGDSSGFTEIKAADAAGDNSIKLPASNGSANQLLQNGGTAGELQYTSAGGGLHCDSSGRLLVGTSTAPPISNGQSIYVAGTGSGDSGIQCVRWNSSFGGYALGIGRSRSGTPGTYSSVSNNDDLGSIIWYGDDGADLNSQAASINAEVDGTPGTDVMPGKITFSTNAGGASVTPRVEIGSNGALKLLAGCPGIDFSGIQTNAAGMTSETLDSYEEGTFSPVDASAAGLTYASATGVYTKIGRNVTCWVRFFMPTTTNTAILLVGGFPFNASADQAYSGGYIHYGGAGIDINFRRYGAHTFIATRDGGNAPVTNNQISGVEIQAMFVYATS